MAAVLTFDRYLLRSFWHVFAVCFITLFGLVVVIDLLENLDEFLSQNAQSGPLALAWRIFEFYALQSAFFLDRAGPSLAVMAAVIVLILFQRSGELHPLLAAGVPMYRVLLPLVGAAACVSAGLVVNQELVIPRIAYAAYQSRGGSAGGHVRVEPVYDYSTRISIDGRQLRLAERTVEDALFVLPAPGVAAELTILKARRAVHCAARGDRPAGWLLRGVEPRWPDLQLTEMGRQIVQPGPEADEVFIVTAVTCDQLYKRNTSYTLLSTREILRRIRSPAFGQTSVQRMIAHLHVRLTQPLLNVISVLIVLPLMVRRESRGLILDSACTLGALAVLFGITQGCQYLGQIQAVAPDLAAWLPVFLGGTSAAWLSGWMRT
jgi:lipopolysaccharide export system permease protein